MTDVLVRSDFDDEVHDLLPESDGARPASSLLAPVDVSWAGRVLFVTLSGSIALLAFALIPSHAAGSRGQALALAAVAWLELGAAILVLVKPTRALLSGTIALNIGVVLTFVLSHIAGLPGGVRGPTASATPVAVVAAVLAVGLVVVASIVLTRHGIGRAWDTPNLVLATVIPVGVIGIVTAALLATGIPSSATVAPVAASVTTDATSSGASTTATTVATGPALAEGEATESLPDVALDPATQKVLGDELVQARTAALQYPTVADAKKAGMVLAGGMAPGVGAHYQRMDAGALAGINPDGSVNPSRPSSFIYGGASDDSPIVGVMYTSMADTAPTGFAGPNDHWHRHSNVCVKFADGKITVPFAADSDVTKDQCDALGGFFMEKTVWMVHAWVVPGWESPKGVFSHDNPNLHCPGPANADGTDKVDGTGICVQQ